MAAFHSLIGVGEALITGLVVQFVFAQRPELLYAAETASVSGTLRPVAGLGKAVAAGLLLALAVAIFLAPFASGYDDGLDAVAGRLGFDALEHERVLGSLLDACGNPVGMLRPHGVERPQHDQVERALEEIDARGRVIGHDRSA